VLSAFLQAISEYGFSFSVERDCDTSTKGIVFSDYFIVCPAFNWIHDGTVYAAYQLRATLLNASNGLHPVQLTPG